MKEKRKHQGCGEEYNVKKKQEKGKQYHLSYNIWAVGNNIKWGRGNGVGNLGKKSRFYENGGGEEYQVVGPFIHLVHVAPLLLQRYPHHLHIDQNLTQISQVWRDYKKKIVDFHVKLKIL